MADNFGVSHERLVYIDGDRNMRWRDSCSMHRKKRGEAFFGFGGDRKDSCRSMPEHCFYVPCCKTASFFRPQSSLIADTVGLDSKGQGCGLSIDYFGWPDTIAGLVKLAGSSCPLLPCFPVFLPVSLRYTEKERGSTTLFLPCAPAVCRGRAPPHPLRTPTERRVRGVDPRSVQPYPGVARQLRHHGRSRSVRSRRQAARPEEAGRGGPSSAACAGPPAASTGR